MVGHVATKFKPDRGTHTHKIRLCTCTSIDICLKVAKRVDVIDVRRTSGKKVERQGRKVERQGRKVERQGRKVERQGRKVERQGRKVERQGRK